MVMIRDRPIYQPGRYIVLASVGVDKTLIIFITDPDNLHKKAQ